MNIYTGPVFDMACRQFTVIADHLNIPEDQRDRLLYPKRAVSVSIPIHREDGTKGLRCERALTASVSPGTIAGRRSRSIALRATRRLSAAMCGWRLAAAPTPTIWG